MTTRPLCWLLALLPLGCAPGDQGDWPSHPRTSELPTECHPSYGAGIIGLELVDMSGTPTVSGEFPSVFSNESVELAGNFQLDGDAISAGTVSISGNKLPGGDVIEGAAEITVADPSAAVEAAAQTNDNSKVPKVKVGNKQKSPLTGNALKLSGSQSITLPAGTYYFTSVDVSGQAQINVNGVVTIYLAGAATFNGGSATNSQQDSLSIISAATDELKLNGGGSTATQIFAPNATVRFSGTQDFKGSVVGKEVRISGTADLDVSDDVLSAQIIECPVEEDDDPEDGSSDGGDDGLPPLPPIPN